jgi:hypothetical protein
MKGRMALTKTNPQADGWSSGWPIEDDDVVGQKDYSGSG